MNFCSRQKDEANAVVVALNVKKIKEGELKVASSSIRSTREVGTILEIV